MLRVYVAGPYEASSEHLVRRNIEAARAEAALLWTLGFSVLCPHLNTAQMGGLVPHDQFIAGDLSWVSVSDLLVVIGSWQKSPGARAEANVAEKCNVPVFQHQWPEGPYQNVTCPPGNKLWHLSGHRTQLNITQFRALNMEAERERD